jgi:hypothetical protein
MSEYHRLAVEYLGGTNGSGFIRWHDDRIGSTHAVIISGEVGDALGESNLAAATRILGQWLDDGGDVLEATVGRSGRTWLRTLAVRVYREDGDYTDAWLRAVDEVILPLEDYPLLDEDDYSERQYDAAYESLRLDYGDAVDLVIAAVQEYGRWGLDEYIGDHDEVLECVELHLTEGHWQEEVVLDGLKHYIEQRKNDLDIPTLAALVE